MEGVSLLPLLASADASDVLRPAAGRALFFEHERNNATRHGAWKWVGPNLKKGSLMPDEDGIPKLYSMHTDRGEQHDKSLDFPEKAAELQQMWLRWAECAGVFTEPYIHMHTKPEWGKHPFCFG